MDAKQDFFAQFLIWLTKWWAWAAWIAIGMVGKIGLSLYNGEKLSFWKFMGSTMVACFVGYVASILCMEHCPSQGAFIVPIATLTSDRIVMMIMAFNWNPVAELLINRFKK